MPEFPNLEPLEPGTYVRNVHPCNVGRMPDGVVLGVDVVPSGGYVSVKTGRGSHVYGPAENWVMVEACPEWARGDVTVHRAHVAGLQRSDRLERGEVV